MPGVRKNLHISWLIIRRALGLFPSPRFGDQTVQFIQMLHSLSLFDDLLKLSIGALLELRVQLSPHAFQTSRDMSGGGRETTRKIGMGVCAQAACQGLAEDLV